MCGRFSLGLPYDQIQALDGYGVQIGEWVNQEQFQPRHNIAPRSQAPVVRQRHAAGTTEAPADEANNGVIMQTMKWGVVPHWNKHETNDLSTINARCEAVVEGGGLWGSLRGRKRCVVPCEGYYEWLKKGKERLPHFTKREDGKLMLLAGLYDVVTLEGETTPLYTFTIVTTDANKDFSWLHDRQPVILPTPEAVTKWLDTSSQQWSPDLTKLVQPYSDQESKLTCYPVPKEVGKVGTESATFIEPISERKDGIQAMFARQKISTTGSPSKASTASPSKIKRKRSSSPAGALSSPKRHKAEESASPRVKAAEPEVVDLCDTDDDEKPETSPEKLDTWEDDSEIEYIGHGASQNDAKQSKSSNEKPRKKGRPDKPRMKAPGNSKITSFFNKP